MRAAMPTSSRQPTPAVAVATQTSAPAITADDALAFDAFHKRTGIAVEAIPWNTPDVDWSRFQAIIIRSTWDYHHHVDAFLAWADRVEAAGARLWNPAAVIRWNADKKYLLELERQGVAIVPTERLVAGAQTDLANVLRRRGWPEAVVKPAVSASAYRTWTTTLDAAASHQAELDALLAEGDALVQPLLAEIRGGEWSLVHCASASGALELSHAVLKRPKDGDFRVQSELGGNVSTPPLPAGLHERTRDILAAAQRCIAAPLLFARVDGVVSDGRHAPAGRFLLMELELIEPHLFFGETPGSGDRFAQALTLLLDR
jgi:glutathione synthase/RimK-type ligase-like ATP-grasp enzyme